MCFNFQKAPNKCRNGYVEAEGQWPHPGSSPCRSSPGSTGRSRRWGCRSRSRCTGTAQHSPSQTSRWDTLQTQGTLLQPSKGMAANHSTQHSAIRQKIHYDRFSLMKQNSSGKQGKYLSPFCLHPRSENNRKKSYQNPFFCWKIKLI